MSGGDRTGTYQDTDGNTVVITEACCSDWPDCWMDAELRHYFLGGSNWTRVPDIAAQQEVLAEIAAEADGDVNR